MHPATVDRLLALFLALIAMAGVLDMRADLIHGAATAHLVREAVVTVLATAAGLYLLLRIRRQQGEIQRLQHELQQSRQAATQAQQYVQDARRQMARVVQRQFVEWGLSDSEQAIGWLILKGFSLKEIALLRNTQEKTVRQQASSIYHKAGLPGRHAFSGWFIEDWLQTGPEAPR